MQNPRTPASSCPPAARIAPALVALLGLVLCLGAPPLAAQAPGTEPAPKEPAAEEPGGTAAAAAAAPTKVAFLRPTGAYADLPEMGFDPTMLLGGGGGRPRSFFALIDAFDALAEAEGQTVLLDLSRQFELNLPQVREVERALGRVRAAGKKVVCYLENAGTTAVQIAALCDRVLMPEMGVLEFGSPAMSVLHFKDALDLMGVHAEMSRVGEYKGAVEPFVRPSMSEPLREHYAAMLATMNADIVRRVAAGRGLDEQRVRELQAVRLFPAAAAREAGLVDALVPWEGAERALRAELGADETELVDAMPKKRRRSRDLFALLAEMFRTRGEDAEIEDPELVVLHLSGGIADGSSAMPGSIVAGPAVEAIDALADNDNVLGVVVRINSPGGSATASEAVRRALQRLAEEKPVVFSMGRVAASGGYWITCVGRPILAEASTITGSIGVFSLRFEAGALMRRLGLQLESVALDEGATLGAIDRPLSDTARERIQSLVDGVYDRFVGLVAQSREKTDESVRAIAGGRVWSGTQAVELGLVDRIGGLADALAMVREAASAAADVEVRHLPEPRDFASVLVEQMFDARALLAAEPRLRVLLGRTGFADLLLTLLRDAWNGGGIGRVYALLPADLTVR